MKRIALSLAAALGALAIYVGLWLFVLWGGSPGAWPVEARLFVWVFGVLATAGAFYGTFASIKPAVRHD